MAKRVVRPETELDVMVLFKDALDIDEKQFEKYFEVSRGEGGLIVKQIDYIERLLWLKIHDLVKSWNGKFAQQPRRFIIPVEKKAEPKVIPIDEMMPPAKNEGVTPHSVSMDTSKPPTIQIENVECTESNAQTKIKLSDIVIDKDFMMRDGLDKETIALYKENLENIVASDPIVLFTTPKGLMLVDGFHRLTAAKQLNWESILAKVHAGSVQDAYAYACTANLKHGKPLTPKEKKRAICEYIKLNVELSNVQIGVDVGLPESTIRNYRRELETKGEITPQEIRIGINGVPQKVGDKIGSQTCEPDPFGEWFNNHIICDDVFNVLPDDPLKYDLIIVDPPYGITNEEWDKQTKFDLLNFTRRWLNLVLNKLKPTGRLFIFWSREHLFELKPLLDEIKNEYPLNFGGLIVWNFRNSLTIPNNRKEFKITWEPIFHFYRDDAPELNRPDTELTGEKWESVDSDVWTYAIPQSNFEKDKRIHPAQKPLDLYKHIIKLSTKTNDSILDPFAGSGTTGHAAYELGREFKLIEKNPEYCDRIRKRLKEVF